MTTKRALALALPVAIIAALAFYAWADVGWLGIMIVVACVAYMPVEARRERRKLREEAEIEDWKRGVQ